MVVDSFFDFLCVFFVSFRMDLAFFAVRFSVREVVYIFLFEDGGRIFFILGFLKRYFG